MNFLLDHLRKNHKIQIPKYNLRKVLQYGDKTQMLEILWPIIYKNSIEWISYFGINGEKGILNWINESIDDNIQNFSKGWNDGKLFCRIFHRYYPNKIAIDKINNNSTLLNARYSLSKFKELGAEIYIEPTLLSNSDEQCIILQCASLFNFIISAILLNKEMNIKIDEGQPDFYSGQLDKDSIDKLYKNVSEINLKINEIFNVTMPFREPVQIAYLPKDSNSINFMYEKFNEVVKRAGSRPIIFVSCLGRYQQGKSSFVQWMSGNLSYGIGNGIKEETNGVFIDGPYEIDYFYKRFDVQMREDIYYGGNQLLSPLIFFLDIEGYGGILHGQDVEHNNKIFIELCAPFLCLSSVFLFFADPNSGNIEIKELFERLKISSLTTYSNTDTNGALSLLIIINQTKTPTQMMHTYDQEQLFKNIKNIENKYKENWIGIKQLIDYGINHDFSQILFADVVSLDNGSFRDTLQYTCQKVIRLIENAAEGSFMRCAQESINLLQYISLHFNEPSFEGSIKAIIKEQHEKSFETISIRATNNLRDKLYPEIDLEYEKYEQNLLKPLNKKEIEKKFIDIATIEIKNSLSSVQDHPNVSYYIEQFIYLVKTKLNQKYDKYIEIKQEKIEDLNSQLERETDESTKVLFDQIKKAFSDTQNIQQINQIANEKLAEIKTQLDTCKTQNEYKLLPSTMIDSIFNNKSKKVHELIDTLVIKKREEAENLQKEIIFMSKWKIEEKIYINKLYSTFMNDNIKILKENLEDKNYYVTNYQKIDIIVDEIQDTISQSILLQEEQIINDLIQMFIKNDKNESMLVIIKRLQEKQSFSINGNKVQSIISSKKFSLKSQVSTLFSNARSFFAETKIEVRKTRISTIKNKVEVRKIYHYPDGTVKEEEWENCRVEKRPFKEIMSEIGEIILSVFTVIISVVGFAVDIKGKADAFKKK